MMDKKGPTLSGQFVCTVIYLFISVSNFHILSYMWLAQVTLEAEPGGIYICSDKPEISSKRPLFLNVQLSSTTSP